LGISSPVAEIAQKPAERRATLYRAFVNADCKTAHRAFLLGYALPRFLDLRGEPATLIECNAADVADVGDIPDVTVRADKYVLPRTFYLAKVDHAEIPA
jgi:hypothetical protein